jgi:hypothetical protein
MACTDNFCHSCGLEQSCNQIWAKCPRCGSQQVTFSYDDFETGESDDEASDEVSQS